MSEMKQFYHVRSPATQSNVFPVSNRSPLVFILGPCQAESWEHVMRMSRAIREVGKEFGVQVAFKASFDKANRTALSSKRRSMSMAESLQALADVRKYSEMMVTTDVHDVSQVASVGDVVDIIQIPALLSRQTDLLVAAGKYAANRNRIVSIKKGQFMMPSDMAYAVEKTKGAKTIIIERGTSFGYGDLVVDMRALESMGRIAPVFFDATHSTQYRVPGQSTTSGSREMAEVLARAAVAVGVAGVFMEVHDDPDNAPSDGPSMIALDDLRRNVESLLKIDRLVKRY